MGETANYQLYITDDSTTKFIDWRAAINGTTDSNMTKIDAALGEKANSSLAVSATLYADQWTAYDSIYMQDIEIDGLTAEQNGVIGAAQNLTEDQLTAIREAGLFVYQQEAGYITVALDGTVPSCDIPAIIILLG